MAMQMPSSGGRSPRRRVPMAEINVTPFVDVMLVLLIIFMITAPLLVSGVPVDLPETRANALEQDKEPIQISIDEQGRTFVDDEELAGTAFEERLAVIAQQQSDDNPRQIMLRGDRALDYGLVMRVMGELNRAGLNKVSLVTTGSSGKE